MKLHFFVKILDMHLKSNNTTEEALLRKFAEEGAQTSIFILHVSKGLQILFKKFFSEKRRNISNNYYVSVTNN